MDRNLALQILHEALPGLKARFGIMDLALFGSVARDDASPESDVDVLVTFDGPATLRRYVGLQESLTALLGSRVDLATPKSIRPRLRSRIEKDLIHVR